MSSSFRPAPSGSGQPDKFKPSRKGKNPEVSWNQQEEHELLVHVSNGYNDKSGLSKYRKRMADGYWAKVTEQMTDQKKTASRCQFKFHQLEAPYLRIRRLLAKDPNKFTRVEKLNRVVARKGCWLRLADTDNDLCDLDHFTLNTYNDFRSMKGSANEDKAEMLAEEDNAEIQNEDELDNSTTAVQSQDNLNEVDEEDSLFVSQSSVAPVTPRSKTSAISGFSPAGVSPMTPRIKSRKSLAVRAAKAADAESSKRENEKKTGSDTEPSAKKPKVSSTEVPNPTGIALADSPVAPPAAAPNNDTNPLATLDATTKQEIAIETFLQDARRLDLGLTADGTAEMVAILENTAPATSYLMLTDELKKTFVRRQLKKNLDADELAACFS